MEKADGFIRSFRGLSVFSESIASFTDIRNLFVESFDDDDISEDEFLLLQNKQQQQLYFLTLNIQISHHLQIARLIEAGGVWTA